LLNVNGLRVTDAVFPGQLYFESHFHERASLTVVLRGRFDKVFPRSAALLQQGSMLSTPAAELHKDLAGCGGARLLYIEPDHTHPAWNDSFHPVARLFHEVNIFRDDRVTELARQISLELSTLNQFSVLAVESLAMELLACAAGVAEPGHQRTEPPRWLWWARDYLHASFHRPIAIADVAEVAGVHPIHLTRVFRRHIGVSMGEYTRRLRLTWAAGQLAGSDLTLAEVAVAAGFVDQSHFTRVFKRHTGLTPGQFRAAQRTS
jgi:AraC family transcriptional regulator